MTFIAGIIACIWSTRRTMPIHPALHVPDKQLLSGPMRGDTRKSCPYTESRKVSCCPSDKTSVSQTKVLCRCFDPGDHNQYCSHRKGQGVLTISVMGHHVCAMLRVSKKYIFLPMTRTSEAFPRLVLRSLPLGTISFHDKFSVAISRENQDFITPYYT